MKFNIGDEVLVHGRFRAVIEYIRESDNAYFIRYDAGNGAEYCQALSLSLVPKPI